MFNEQFNSIIIKIPVMRQILFFLIVSLLILTTHNSNIHHLVNKLFD